MSTDLTSLSKQVGGGHYKGYAYQPVEFFVNAGLDYVTANVIKYVVRYKDKNGIEDLRKAVHYCSIAVDMMLRLDEPSDKVVRDLDRFIAENALDDLVAEAIRDVVFGYYLNAINTLCVLGLEEYGEDIGVGIVA